MSSTPARPPLEVYLLGLVDFAIHGIVDRVKALKGQFPMTAPQFWWWLGGDQGAHHITHYLLISAILFLR